jgi:hypothetical protein
LNDQVHSKYGGNSQKNEVGRKYIFNPRKINTYLRQKKAGKYDFVSIIAVRNSEPSIWPAPQLAPFIRRVCSSFALRPILGSQELELSGMGDADGTQFVLMERG